MIDDNPNGSPLTDFHHGLTSAAAGLKLPFPFWDFAKYVASTPRNPAFT